MTVDLSSSSDRSYPWVAWSFIFLFKSEIVIAIKTIMYPQKNHCDNVDQISYKIAYEDPLNDPHVDDNDLEDQEGSSEVGGMLRFSM